MCVYFLRQKLEFYGSFIGVINSYKKEKDKRKRKRKKKHNHRMLKINFIHFYMEFVCK